MRPKIMRVGNIGTMKWDNPMEMKGGGGAINLVLEDG